MTKTMQALIARKSRADVDGLTVVGARECGAARALVAAGLAKEYHSQSEMRYTRTGRAYADIAGRLIF
jgi:hypothetical protein